MMSSTAKTVAALFALLAAAGAAFAQNPFPPAQAPAAQEQPQPFPQPAPSAAATQNGAPPDGAASLQPPGAENGASAQTMEKSAPQVFTKPAAPKRAKRKIIKSGLGAKAKPAPKTAAKAGRADSPEAIEAKSETPAEKAANQKLFEKAASLLRTERVQGPGFQILARFTGTTAAEDYFDLSAGFDGKISEFDAVDSQWVEKDESVGLLVSRELAAILNATGSKESAKRRWGKVFDMARIASPETGLIVKTFVKDRDDVLEGDRLLTVARKLRVLARIDGKHAGSFDTGMAAVITGPGGVKALARLESFKKEKTGGFYRLKLLVTSAKRGIGPGMTVEGGLVLLDHPGSQRVPASALFRRGGQTYLLTLTPVETGLSDEGDVELAGGAQADTEFIYPRSLLAIYKARSAAQTAKSGPRRE